MITKVRNRKQVYTWAPTFWAFMLCLLVPMAVVHPSFAQSAPPTDDADKTAPAKPGTTPDEAGKDGAKKEDPEQRVVNPPPVNPESEGFRFGMYEGHAEVEAGYRWSSGVNGNSQMYRSQVNLFEGARLLRSFVSLRSNYGSGGLFDRLDLSLNNWGDPYQTLRLNVGRSDLYRLDFSYRDLEYYNFISTWANPLLDEGDLFAQHNRDIHYKLANVVLRLFPNRSISPYFGYYHNSATGPANTTYYPTGNEFVLKENWQYSGDEYRGGVQFTYPTWSLTLEQGFRHLKNDTGVVSDGLPLGNNPVPFLGNDIVLDSLDRGYHGRTDLPVSKVIAKFNPYTNLGMTARYIYSMGSVDSDLGEVRQGSFVSLEDLLVYSAALDTFTGKAKRPNHNGSFVVRYAPVSRLTFTDRVETIDYNVSGQALLSSVFIGASSLLGPGAPVGNTSPSEELNTRYEYSRLGNRAEGEYDLGHGFALRGGYHYTFTDVTIHDSEGGRQEESVSRNTALAGFYFRQGQWLRLGFDFESTGSNRVLTRTSMLDYDRYNIDWRLGPWKGLTFHGRVALLHNTNPAEDIDFTSHDRDYSAGLTWEPNDRFSFDLDYSRINYFTDLLIVIPQNLKEARSIFDERTSGIGGRAIVGLYHGSRVEFGYRGIINRGSWPLDYHQPYASLWIPLKYNIAFRPYWQYYDYAEKLFPLENYQTHLVTFSLVFSK